VTLSESEEELRNSARSHGWSLEGINILEIIAGEESLKPVPRFFRNGNLRFSLRCFCTVDAAGGKPTSLWYQSVHPDARTLQRVELTETTKMVLTEVERTKPARLVFDSVSELRLLAQEPLHYRRQIFALKQWSR
jgi:circadian clock protein KaiC